MAAIKRKRDEPLSEKEVGDFIKSEINGGFIKTENNLAEEHKQKKKKKEKKNKEHEKGSGSTNGQGKDENIIDTSTIKSTEKNESSEGKMSRAEKRKLFWGARLELEAAETAAKQTEIQGGVKEPVKIVKKKKVVEPNPIITTIRSEDNKRYLLFVGNMAFDTTKEDITAHFALIGGIKDIRILVKKDTNIPKGCAFVEFDNRVSHGKALGMHKSTLKGRVINVELTVGGGGNGETRKKKVEAKNQTRRAERKKEVEEKKKQLAASVPAPRPYGKPAESNYKGHPAKKRTFGQVAPERRGAYAKPRGGQSNRQF